MGDLKAQHGSTPTKSAASMRQDGHDNLATDDKYYGSDDNTDDVNQRLLTTDGPSGPPSKPSHRKSIRTGDKSRTKDMEGNRKQETARWRDLPEKGQLVVLTLARLSEPLVQTSLQVSCHCLYIYLTPPANPASRTCSTSSSPSDPTSRPLPLPASRAFSMPASRPPSF